MDTHVHCFHSPDKHSKMQATWERQIKTGAMDSRKYKSRGGVGAIRCKNGTADVIPGDPLNTFRCSNVRIPQ